MLNVLQRIKKETRLIKIIKTVQK